MPCRKSRSFVSQSRRIWAKRAISSQVSAPAMTPHNAITTMFNNGWAIRLRRRRGSGKRAKNFLMETGVSEDERDMRFLRGVVDLHGHHSRTLSLFQSI